MKKRMIFALASLCLWVTSETSGHPASGIVVDPNGDVYFVYSGHGVCKVEPQGEFTYVHHSRGGHWLCLDPDGGFSQRQPKFFE